MTRILYGILICTLISMGMTQAQSRKNPFELLHKKGNQPDTASVAADTSRSANPVNSPDSVLTPVVPVNPPLPDSGKSEKVTAGDITGPDENENDTGAVLPVPPRDPHRNDSTKIREAQENIASGKIDNEVDTSKISASTITPDDSLKLVEIIPVLPREVVKRNKLSGAFLALIFLGILLLLTIIVNINRKLLYQVYRASLNENYSALLYRERKHSAFNYLYSIAYVIFFINAGLFIYQAQFLDIWFHPDTYALWVFILFPVVIYGIRHLVMRLLASVFPISKEINQFNFNIIVFNIMIGLFLIPVNLFIAFGPEVLHVPIVYASIVGIGLFYIFRQLRGVLIATPLLQNSLFLFFIYLCTVEILPFAVIFKLLA